jgi:spore germination protein KA
MFRYLRKLILSLKVRRRKPPPDDGENIRPPEDPSGDELSEKLSENITRIRSIFGSSPDLVVREFNIGRCPGHRAALILIEGVTNTDLINTNILKPLMFDFIENAGEAEGSTGTIDIEDIFNNFVPACNTKKVFEISELAENITKGYTALIIDGLTVALSVGAKKWEARAVTEPTTETVIRGPHTGFTESLGDNVALLRRVINNPSLRFEQMKIGRYTKTDVLIAYIDGIVNPPIIDEVKKRLNDIDIDGVLDSGYIEAYIQDSPYSVFNTVGNTERPDVVSSRLLEGRVAIMADGSPFALTVPMLFIENFQAPADYYRKFNHSSFVRILRYIAFAITTMAPALYVAITTFHQELIPTKLLFTMVSGHEKIPFPATVEAFMMLIIFDILFEAGLRLPQAVGNAVSIVGALVLGEAAVSAGLISPFMVIIVSLTAISNFVASPQLYTAITLRYLFTILGALFGGFGIILGLMLILVHMFSIKSFGILFMAPLNAVYSNDYEDSFIILPNWKMKFRPDTLASPNRRRRRGSPNAD